MARYSLFVLKVLLNPKQTNVTHCFMVHGSLSMVRHAPFNASVLRPALQAGPMHESAGVGQANLLSLMKHVWVYAVLPSSLVGPACVQASSSNPRCRACRPNGKVSGEEGILSDVVPVYLYCPALVSVLL